MTVPLNDRIGERLAELTVVADGDAYVIGNPRNGSYVAVPPVGAAVIGWLRAGDSPDLAAARAEAMVGEPVDVGDFLDVLAAEGVLALDPSLPAAPGVGAGWQHVGRILFSPVGWLTQVSLVVVAAVCTVLDPTLLPRGADVVVLGSPLASVLIMTLAAVLCTVLHEAGHLLAAAAVGVPTRLSISRRLYFLAAQADLTGLWALPRAQRLPPLLAGMSVDGAVTALLIIIQHAGASEPVTQVLAAVVVLQLAAIVFQAAVFIRTDLYAVLATVSGSRNLWALKSAVFRRLLRRETKIDQDMLAAASRRQRSWAMGYLALYLPGLLAAGWYLLEVTIPGLVHLLGVIGAGLMPFDVDSGHAWQSLAALVFVVAPTAGTMAAAAMAGVRSIVAVLGRQGADDPPLPQVHDAQEFEPSSPQLHWDGMV